VPLVPSPSSTNGPPLSASPFQLIRIDAPDDQPLIQLSRPGGPHPASFSPAIAMPRNGRLHRQDAAVARRCWRRSFLLGPCATQPRVEDASYVNPEGA
jgi:hypothetical protein